MRTQNDIKQIFGQMANKIDFINLLNIVREKIVDPEVKPFSEKEVGFYTLYSGSEDQNKKLNLIFKELIDKGVKVKKINPAYKTFEIKKKSGGSRKIHAPKKRLKLIQKCLNHILREIHSPHNAAKGFVPKVSIVDNARTHTKMNYVLNVDIKDFFPSVDQARVRARLLTKPFDLGNTPERVKIASVIAILCCTKMEVERYDSVKNEWYTTEKYVLPQGAPTSPTMTNIICERLDILLTGLANRFHCKYSRYADDITFSCMNNVFRKTGEFYKELERIILDQGFHIKESKTRVQSKYYRQEVTGLVVNEEVNVNKRYIREIRKWVYYWETYGYEKAEGIFISQYLKDKGHVRNGKPDMANVLWGKLQYLKMVKGVENKTFSNLNTKFNKLDERTTIKNKPDIVENILKLGLDVAMEQYNIN